MTALAAPSRTRGLTQFGFLACLIVLVVLPVASVLYGALQDRSPVYGDTQFSLDAVANMLGSGDFAQALGNTLALSAVVTVFAGALGVVLGWLVIRTDLPGRRVFEVLLIAPLFLSPLTGAMAWLILAAPNVGFLNIALREMFGWRQGVNIFSFTGIAFVMAVYYVPYAFMAASAVFTGIAATLEDSARVLGAGLFRTTWRITLRLALPAITGAGLLIFMLSAEMFTIPGLLGRPIRFETLVNAVYTAIHREPARWNEAASMGLVLLVFVAGGLLLKGRLDGTSRRYGVVTGQATRARTTKLGAARWPAFVSCVLVVLVSVVLPLAALVFASFLQFTTSNFRRMVFTLGNYRALGEGIAFDAVMNTLALSLIVPTLVVGFVLAVGIWCRHYEGTRLARLFVFLMQLPLCLPGVVLGIGLLWLYFRIPLPIYGTLVILLLAYVAKAMPFVSGNVLPALDQLDRSLDESARVLGAGPLRVLRRIQAPLTLRALVGAWLIAFILCARELNASIMLYTPGTRVMEVLIWDLMESGRSNLAYAISVVQALAIGGLAALLQTYVRGARRVT